jgi:hypothetical protein
LRRLILSIRQNSHGARDYDPAAACRPPQSCQRRTNLEPQNRYKGFIDMTVQPELTENIAVLFTAPSHKATRRHQGQQHSRERRRKQNLETIAAQFAFQFPTPVTPLVVREIIGLAP